MPSRSETQALGFGTAHGSLRGGRLLIPSNEFLSTPVRRDTSVRCARPSAPVTIRCRRGSNHKNRQRGDGRRPNRVGELIRREISPIIDDAFARARLADTKVPVLVSVVDVKCSDDLRNARVSISVLGTDEQKVEALRWLRAARKELRFELAQCVRLKHIPDLSFSESEVAAAVKTMNILDRLAKEREEKSSGVQQKVGAGVRGMDDEATRFRDGKDWSKADDLGDFDGYIDDDDDGEAVIIDVVENDEDEGDMGFNADEMLKQ